MHHYLQRRHCLSPASQAFVLALLAGAYLGFAGLLSFTLLNAVPGGCHCQQGVGCGGGSGGPVRQWWAGMVVRRWWVSLSW